jgi:xanthine dehydrogenase accessory factor
MISATITRRADELAAQGEAFVAATVVRVERPTSVQPGNVALVHEDGTIEGFVGGVCAQHSVRLYSLKAIESGEPLLLRILPDGPSEPPGTGAEDGREVHREEGVVTVQNPCLSGGSIEVFLEPFLPAPRVLVAGDSPIALALARLGPEVGLEIVATQAEEGGTRAPDPADLALVVAAHGRDEVEILRAGLEAGVEYVGLVASRKRGAAIIDQLRADGVAEELLAVIDSPAGFDIGARAPSEIAVAILARIIEVRRTRERAVGAAAARPATAATAVDPICGMTVVLGPDTPQLEHGGEPVYFCGEGCKRSFEVQQAA